VSSRSWLATSLRSRTGLLQWASLIAAIGFVVWILWTRGDDLRVAFDLTPRLFVLITLSAFATFALNGIELQVLAGRFGRRIPFLEGQLLGLMVSTLNYLPMKTGTMLNGVLMRARYRLPLTHFTALVGGSSVIHLWVALACAGVALLLHPGGDQLLGIGFIAGPTALVLGLIWWGRTHTSGRFDEHSSRIVRVMWKAIDGVGLIFADARLLAIEIVINLALIVLWALRMYWSFEALGVEATFGAAFIVTALGILFSRLSVIPGGIGFRESGSALGSALTGLSASLGFAASVIDRAVTLVWLLVVGVPATLYLLRLAGVSLDDALTKPAPADEGDSDSAR
jgi:uncharacterized membrane protein YbhN (UPF0104 family)